MRFVTLAHTRMGADVDTREDRTARWVECRAELGHALVVRLGLLLRRLLLGHDGDVVRLLECERHPKMGVRVEGGSLLCELLGKLDQQGAHQGGGDGERPQGGADLLHVGGQVLRRHVVRHLLQLRRRTARVDGDETVLVELLRLPLLL